MLAPYSYKAEYVQAFLAQLDTQFPQEHICSAAPTVLEDYKGTAALNRELEVIPLRAIWTYIDAGQDCKCMPSQHVSHEADMCRHLWLLRSHL